MLTTYSFLDSVVIISHPMNLPITVTGEGAGSISVSYQDPRTSHDVAADGAVMVSKQAGNTGAVSITVQQTSSIHKMLLKLFNQLIIAAPSMWAAGAITIKNITDGTGHLCTGFSFSKIPDKTYTKTGGQVSWTLMCADIQSLTV
jgi:hypothetical protein